MNIRMSYVTTILEASSLYNNDCFYIYYTAIQSIATNINLVLHLIIRIHLVEILQ